jgi:hypothetical protein
MYICLTNIIQFYKMLGTYIKIIKTLCVSVHTRAHTRVPTLNYHVFFSNCFMITRTSKPTDRPYEIVTLAE